uniref:Putative cytochrome n=1 Tax=Panstrongylus lignarius TaxID=156445 RepID=A0A224XNM6_9HEMI
MDVVWILCSLILALIGYIYLIFKEKYKYWERKGVTYVKPLPFFGSLLPSLLCKRSIGDIYKEAYEEFPNENVVGLYEIKDPVLVLRDPQVIEKILVKDFLHFVDHAQIVDDEGLFSKGLFQLKGNTWRAIRYKLSPAFTTGKLKLILPSMLESTEGMVNAIKQNLYKDYEVKEALSNYTMDIIANSVLGLTITNEKARNEFAKMGTAVFDVKIIRFISLLMISYFPKFSKFLGLKFLNEETTTYFTELIKNTFDKRKDERYQRNDYVQHLLKLKEKGSIEIQTKDEDDVFLNLDSKPPIENIEISDQILYGQAFQFLTAGFDPLFNTIMFALFDMTRFPKTQERARQEIIEVLERHGGYTYEAIKDMTYVEQCVQETLRLHPLTPFLFRECTKSYVTDDGLEIDKGVKVVIPINAIHMDPKYFVDPEEFNPERIAPNSVRNNFTYMPFGDGPRMCIGLRFALLELKLGLAKLLENFKFTLSPRTKVPFEFNKLAFVPFPTSKIFFNITPA